MKSLKQFFLEPKIPYGVFIVIIIILLLVIWFGNIKGNEIKLLGLIDIHRIGDNINTPNFSVNVSSLRRDSVGGGPLVPKPGYEFIVPTISVQNMTDEPIDFIPLLFFYIKDSEGNVYNVTSVPSQTNQLSGPILAHDKLKEEIGFEIPKTAKGLKLYFEPGTTKYVVVVDLEVSK